MWCMGPRSTLSWQSNMSSHSGWLSSCDCCCMSHLYPHLSNRFACLLPSFMLSIFAFLCGQIPYHTAAPPLMQTGCVPGGLHCCHVLHHQRGPGHSLPRTTAPHQGGVPCSAQQGVHRLWTTGEFLGAMQVVLPDLKAHGKPLLHGCDMSDFTVTLSKWGGYCEATRTPGALTASPTDPGEKQLADMKQDLSRCANST